MSKKYKYVVWISVTIIDFILLNAGLDGWFVGFAQSSFKSEVEKLLLDNYFESLIIPIVLILIAYTIVGTSISNRTSIDHVKKHLTVYLITLMFISQIIVFYITNSQIKNTIANIRSVSNSIGDYVPTPSFFGDHESMMYQLSALNHKFEKLARNIDNLETDIQYIQR